MAVTQVSQIQVRYGLQEDIGSLAGGEFAWAIDTQRLFIGNGLIEEGAPVAGITEIMTNNFDLSEMFGNYQYTYIGRLGGYDVITGPNPGEPVIRTLQDKLDDFVNVRDFAVSSTGNVDETASLQRALDELYSRKSPITGQRTKRALRFNGGTYRIDGELKIPPYVSLVGEGIDSVKIILNGPSAKLVTTTGSDPAFEISLGSYPFAVSIKGMTIEQSTDNDIFQIEGATNIVFEDVAFKGPRSLVNTSGSGACVTIRSTARPTFGVHFNRCTFTGLGYGAYIESTVGTNDIVFNNCYFNDLWNAIRTEYTTGYLGNIKVSNSYFKDIFSSAIYGDSDVKGIFSSGNTFINCASGREGDIAPSGPWEPILVFQANNNHSVGDYFARSLSASRQYPRIDSSGYAFAYLSLDDCFRLGAAQFYSGKELIASNSSSFSAPVYVVPKGVIEYTVTRADGPGSPNNNTRTGKITFSSKSGNVVWTEDYTETADLGLLLSLSIDTSSDNMLKLNGVVSDQGTELRITYDLKTLD